MLEGPLRSSAQDLTRLRLANPCGMISIFYSRRRIRLDCAPSLRVSTRKWQRPKGKKGKWAANGLLRQQKGVPSVRYMYTQRRYVTLVRLLPRDFPTCHFPLSTFHCRPRLGVRKLRPSALTAASRYGQECVETATAEQRTTCAAMAPSDGRKPERGSSEAWPWMAVADDRPLLQFQDSSRFAHTIGPRP